MFYFRNAFWRNTCPIEYTYIRPCTHARSRLQLTRFFFFISSFISKIHSIFIIVEFQWCFLFFFLSIFFFIFLHMHSITHMHIHTYACILSLSLSLLFSFFLSLNFSNFYSFSLLFINHPSIRLTRLDLRTMYALLN